MDTPAIACEGLCKRFGNKTALDHLDLSVPQGTVHGLLGPNGAGKTTAVRVLATLLRPESGHARIAGFDVARQAAQVRARIGLTGQNAAVDEILSGRQNLVMFGRLCHLPAGAARRRAGELLRQFTLTEAADKPVRQYSGGMRRRLDLAVSFIVAPRVLFLDEPTTGLDPRGRNEVWQMIRALAAAGTTVLLTTQYLEEADQLAHRVAVLDGGRIVAEGTPAELKARIPGGRIELAFADRAELDAAAMVLTPTGRDDDALTLQLAGDGSVSTLRTLLRRLDDAAVEVEALTVHTPDLDDVFFALTGRKGA